jgi:hypothetical protein
MAASNINLDAAIQASFSGCVFDDLKQFYGSVCPQSPGAFWKAKALALPPNNTIVMKSKSD